MSSYVRVNSSCEPADRDARLNVQQIADYISNLDEWAKTIRFPSKSSAKRQDFELIVRQMTGDLSRLCAKVQEVEHQQSQQPSMNCMSQCTDEPANRGEALFDESCESHVDRLMSKARIVALPESLHVPAHQDAADQEAPSPHCHASRRRRSSSHRPPPISDPPQPHPDLVPEDLDSCERYLRSCLDADDLPAGTPTAFLTIQFAAHAPNALPAQAAARGGGDGGDLELDMLPASPPAPLTLLT
eukprot:CAMPEP_0113704446 /NCGR_PEP_ID=MMETSP0038_2-20120614/26525_1 /TAXON_ID=2898 /ORGANISM="Cryptomonas paramecium" /LENGTH=243 /DNA_ID=CAMNT_0000629231 /DNA_START=803 /DNA_END=1530 /DNA_ORIENTATION=- /assembly_acc=CAM_ASM_000170